MRLEAALIREGEHLVVDARGIAEPQHVHTPVYEPFAYPVYRHVALCADQHLRFAAKRLRYRLDPRRECIASARRYEVFDPLHR